MWIVEQRAPAGDWFTRATVQEREAAEHYARLYKASNPKLRFRYRLEGYDAEWVNALGKAAIQSNAGLFVLAGWGGRDDRGNGTLRQRNRMSGGTFAAEYSRVLDGLAINARGSISPNTFDQTFSIVGTGRATEIVNSVQVTETHTNRASADLGWGLPRGSLTARVAIGRASADFDDTDPRVPATVSRALHDDTEAISLHAGFVPVRRLTLGGGVRRDRSPARMRRASLGST